jgi:formate hydrogenlyase subunit 3/multisubunit Na+/H+ antiporter MnhD subunit
MTLKSYLWGIRSSTAISFAALALVIKQVDPQKTGIAGQLLFFISALLFLSGTFVLLFTWLRRATSGDEEVALAYIGVSFRQGILMAILLCLLLVLQQNRILTWWDGALTVAGILLVELYFLTRGRR